mmetsp:Transcript_48758/g.135974  ORF Transcript_48758/g.135974 Transcript_48758/m.135974 type:complete len:248 (-) Transcript_48758:83-826(-)
MRLHVGNHPLQRALPAHQHLLARMDHPGAGDRPHGLCEEADEPGLDHDARPRGFHGSRHAVLPHSHADTVRAGRHLAAAGARGQDAGQAERGVRGPEREDEGVLEQLPAADGAVAVPHRPPPRPLQGDPQPAGGRPPRGPAGQHPGRERPAPDTGEEPWAPRGLAQGRRAEDRLEEGVREKDQPAVSGARLLDRAEQPRGDHCERHWSQGHRAGQGGAAHRDAALSHRPVHEIRGDAAGPSRPLTCC